MSAMLDRPPEAITGMLRDWANIEALCAVESEGITGANPGGWNFSTSSKRAAYMGTPSTR